MSVDIRTREPKSGAARVPKLMRATAIDRFAGPEALTENDLPIPRVHDDEVLIALHTGAVGS